jgi:hypothetical protein
MPNNQQHAVMALEMERVGTHSLTETGPLLSALDCEKDSCVISKYCRMPVVTVVTKYMTCKVMVFDLSCQCLNQNEVPRE